MNFLMNFLSKIPLASTIFLAYAVVGTVMLVTGGLGYGDFSDNLMAIGIACGAIGIPRAISKVTSGKASINLLGFVESAPVVSIVFFLFVAASSFSLIGGAIEFETFSDNLLKVGIACGAVGAARVAESAAVSDDLDE